MGFGFVFFFLRGLFVFKKTVFTRSVVVCSLLSESDLTGHLWVAKTCAIYLLFLLLLLLLLLFIVVVLATDVEGFSIYLLSILCVSSLSYYTFGNCTPCPVTT